MPLTRPCTLLSPTPPPHTHTFVYASHSIWKTHPFHFSLLVKLFLPYPWPSPNPTSAVKPSWPHLSLWSTVSFKGLKHSLSGTSLLIFNNTLCDFPLCSQLKSRFFESRDMPVCGPCFLQMVLLTPSLKKNNTSVFHFLCEGLS